MTAATVTVSVMMTEEVPGAYRLPACSADCAETIAAKKRSTNEHSRRIVRVGPSEIAGPCSACGASVATNGYRAPATTMELMDREMT